MRNTCVCPLPLFSPPLIPQPATASTAPRVKAENHRKKVVSCFSQVQASHQDWLHTVDFGVGIAAKPPVKKLIVKSTLIDQ